MKFRNLDMRHSRRALAEYDRTAESRDACWHMCLNDAAVRVCQRDDAIAANALKEAFYLDTSDRNNWETCQCVPIQHIRDCVARYGPITHHTY